MPVTCRASKGTSEKPRAARDIQHRIVRTGLRHFNDAVERIFIANGRGSRKGHRLTGELIENMFLVFRPHGLILQFFKWFVGTQAQGENCAAKQQHDGANERDHPAAGQIHQVAEAGGRDQASSVC